MNAFKLLPAVLCLSGCNLLRLGGGGPATTPLEATFVTGGQSNMTRAPLLNALDHDLRMAGKFGKVTMVNLAVGGSYQADWRPGSVNYGSMLEAIKAHRSTVQAVIWWQGEAEGVYGPAETWRENFSSMVRQLRADSGLPNLQIIFVRINPFNCGPFWDAVRQQQDAVNMPNVLEVSSDGIPESNSAECFHFNPTTDAYSIIAQRITDAITTGE